MAKFTSFHLRAGQLFYSKTGSAVPEKMIGRMEVRGKTVYRDGRKVGTLRQKTISKKAKANISKNLKRGRSRVRIKRPRSRPPTGGDDISIPSGPALPKGPIEQQQDVINFSNALDYLVDLKIIHDSDAQALYSRYINGDASERSFLWEYIHSLFNEEGFYYESA